MTKFVKDKNEFDIENNEHVEDMLSKVFISTNKQLNTKLPKITDMSGSTGNLVLILNKRIFCANVGDSEAHLLVYKKGKYD